MPIIEFFDKYPKYNMGFLASNEKTETEKLSGLRMHLLFPVYDSKTYQCFTIPEGYYNELSKRLDALTDNQWLVMGVNDADFYLQRKKGCILGICKQTKERVAISLPIKAFLTEEELAELEYENYMDALGGDWQG